MLGRLGQIDILFKAILDGFDILAVSETWESTLNEQMINIPGYTKISSIRPHGKIGSLESLFIEISNKKTRSKTIIGQRDMGNTVQH